MSLLTPGHPLDDHTTPADPRPVLVLVDQADLADPALEDAVALAIRLAAPLEVVLLHPRLGFTTDAAVAAGFHGRLDAARGRVAATVQGQLAGRRLPFRVSLRPYARWRFREPRGQARRPVQAGAACSN